MLTKQKKSLKISMKKKINFFQNNSVDYMVKLIVVAWERHSWNSKIMEDYK